MSSLSGIPVKNKVSQGSARRRGRASGGPGASRRGAFDSFRIRSGGMVVEAKKVREITGGPEIDQGLMKIRAATRVGRRGLQGGGIPVLKDSMFKIS